MLEILGFLLTSVIAGIFIYLKLSRDLFPIGLKQFFISLILKNYTRKCPQTLSTYNISTPKSVKEAGIQAQDKEWVLERPKKSMRNQEYDDLLFHGVDDQGGILVARVTRFGNGASRGSLIYKKGGGSKGGIYKAHLEGPSSENEMEFSLGNFRLELVEPFRIWRLWFNGCMESDNNQLVHVKINFLWKPLEYPKDSQKDCNISLLSSQLSNTGKFGDGLSNLNATLPKGYHQFGTMHGVMKVNDLEEELYLYGFRTRRFGNVPEKREHLELFAMLDVDGDAIRLVGDNDLWTQGERLYASNFTHPVQWVGADVGDFKLNGTIPKGIDIADKKATARVEIWPKLSSIVIPNVMDVVPLKMEINGQSASGVLVRDFVWEGPPETISRSAILDATNDVENFISIEDPHCQAVSIVGGKGASLGKLAEMKNSSKSTFKTARGFCVTTRLFRKLIKGSILNDIFDESYVPLEERCKRAMGEITTPTTIETLQSLIVPHISKYFEGSHKTLRFAVRSSGVLEDGADLSCAGQNETFLGINSEQIPEKIAECWASLYKHHSVSYRLNNGLPIVTDMGVVVQEMVDTSAAGVLFTAHPQSGNPFEAVITANYGLGESVVSASCDPDTVILTRRANSTDLLKIKEKTVGKKTSKIVISSNKTTEEVGLSQDDSEKFCISDEQIIALGIIGTEIEKMLGKMRPVDIEWAVSEEGQLYILQCRPMTSLSRWTDFEIMHEFDTAIRTRIELLTIANTGEVLPKPLHALSIQGMSRNLDVGVQDRTEQSAGSPSCILTARACPLYNGRSFISLYPTLYRQIEAEITAAVHCIDLAVFGRPVITPEIHQVAVRRNGISSNVQKISGLLNSIGLLWGAGGVVKRASESLSGWRLPLDGLENSKEVYRKITDALIPVHEIMAAHCYISEASSVSLIFAFLGVTEGKGKEDWGTGIYEDVGKLLSVYSPVESAELPSDLNGLADCILADEKCTEAFMNAEKTKEAMGVLEQNEGLNEKMIEFLEKHGHRSFVELDLAMDSWRTDPTPLISLLKNALRNKLRNPQGHSITTSTAKKQQDENELLNSLKTSLSPLTKRFLKFLLPHCRRMVVYREKTKSLAVRTLDQVKQAYNFLAVLMVQEGLLPNVGLIKHLTHHELGILIHKEEGMNNCGGILYRATRRLRLHPVLESYEYQEISVGVPVPIKPSFSTQLEAVDVIKGTPVSAGVITATAKVCLSVEEAASTLEPGDILITRGTDIAWSPFFPMLGGVVTELGGLISHGAVVAREYGLPCIVSAVGATKVFKSGDRVLIDTSVGIVAKVK